MEDTEKLQQCVSDRVVVRPNSNTNSDLDRARSMLLWIASTQDS